jgi:hypothetical protein
MPPRNRHYSTLGGVPPTRRDQATLRVVDSITLGVGVFYSLRVVSPLGEKRGVVHSR